MALVSPSLLSADFGHLADDCEMLNNSEADYAHVDVMDGLFVPNISFGTPVIKAMKRHCNKPLDVHLMITDPGRYVTLFRDLVASSLNVHFEACTHLHRTIQQIRDCGMKPAVTLNPATPVEVLRDILCDVDMVLLMSVNPGFGGQKFITRTLDKAQRLRTIIDEQGLKTLIEVDGGIDTTTAPLAVKAGIDVLVAGSFVFGSKNPIETIKWLKNL
mgnify:FL=1